MIFMEFLNKQIKSDKYGIGTVISIDESVFTIQFQNESKSFNYMIAFKNKALFFVDENDQNEINLLLEQKEQERALEEQKANELRLLREKEEAQRRENKNHLMSLVEQVLAGNDKQLIGDFEFDSDSIEFLTDCFVDSYRRNDESVSKMTDEDVKAFLIVMINKLRDYDKTWNEFPELLSSFFNHLSLFDTQSKITNLYNKIDKLFSDYNRVIFKTNSGKRAFEQTFLFQALAPIDSIQNFVRLAWSLYLDEDILDSSYINSDFELCLRVIDALNLKFAGQNNEDDSIQFSGASYGIRAGLRYGCEQNKEKTAELLNRVFDYIYKVDHFNEEITDNYLGMVVTDVVSKAKQVIIKERKSGEKQYTNGYVHSFEQAKPTLYLNLDQQENPRVLICYPKVMILNSDSNLKCAIVEIYKHYNDERPSERLISSQLQYIKKNDACQTLRSFSIDITDKLTSFEDDFNIEMIVSVESDVSIEKHSSGQLLFRNYLVFKDNHEIKGTTRPGTYCLISPKSFNPDYNLKLFDKNYRKVLNGIYYFTAKDLDLIDYRDTKLLFGSNTRSANVVFNENKMLEATNIAFIPDADNFDFEVPVYLDLSDIYIENENAVTPSSVRISHLTYDENDGSIVKDEKTLNDLKLADRRYFYSADDNNLKMPGLHSIEVIKLTPTGAKSMLNSPKFDYFYDSNALVVCNELPYIRGNAELILKIMNEKYSTVVSYLQTYIKIETNFGMFKVIPPYFRWKFGDELEYKNRPLESPIFVDDIPSSSTIKIDSSIKIIDFVFRPDDENKDYPVDKSSTLENVFLISQFISSQRKKGKFYALSKEYGRLPIFSVILVPYFKETNMILEYDSGLLKYDFSSAFIHDKKNYKIKMKIGTEEFDEPIEIEDLDVNNEGQINIEDFEDDSYTIELYYYTDYSGIKGNDVKIHLKDDRLMFGDVVKAKFNSRDIVVIDKCRVSEGNKKIKDNIITDLKYIFDDGENRVYEGLLKTPFSKRCKIMFYADSPDMIRKVFFLFGANFEIRKEGHFDIQKKSIVSSDVIEDKVFKMSSIYIKK